MNGPDRDVPSPPAGGGVWSAAALRRRLEAFDARALPADGHRRAAVAIPVSEAGHGADLPGLPSRPVWSNEPALLLTRRAAQPREQAGQWALPGGRIDDGESPEDAARRELAEEIGLELAFESVLGRLDDYATRSGYVITPVVVWAGAAREVRPNPGEVEAIHRIPVSELLRADAPLLNRPRSGGQTVLRMPIGERWIAAPTAAFLYQFREVLVLGRATRVAHFDQPFFAWR